ncbi:enoyl-CoA hydratase [Cupriavidus taiwanensis]|uniref:Enoyl-CoA hydratase n=1 Tax=Cupriavidus taiwanensis TaxID=164546 RepID=A0A7Z7JD84_9BURK|nr:enoyl-CoA hydratase [Cupriavidus taiwanensis]SOZ10149.1 Enoyl-CoA hydratase [Cupriavidus taiwanensis]SOZ12318.1 Enoyl-CoA hydratase [Cupriavidus taiwanensis]SOZ43623.1 Enoyl-CoA hydratase [Cupriavidus taiwanensis]SPC22866.1 Enoyl-CoA hydratase [Cupriavidus taiwanensis]SPD54374.1 Enoyl-CoA hydratase [Cupriavidus taiwanensis]
MENLKHLALQVSNQGVATLRIANGTSLNILDSDTIVEFTGTLRRLARRQDVRVLVLRGTGDKAFIGGANIKELAKLDPETAVAFITRLHDLCEAVRDFPVPTIARLSGWCMGGGMEFAAACDIRIADDQANFAMPEVRIGIPSVIHANILPRLIGEGNTRWLLLTGASVDAARAQAWGFLHQVVPNSGLDDAIAHTVAEILECGPAAVRAQKALLRAWEDPAIERGLKHSIEVFGQCYAGPEPDAYMTRFFERKRQR